MPSHPSEKLRRRLFWLELDSPRWYSNAQHLTPSVLVISAAAFIHVFLQFVQWSKEREGGRVTVQLKVDAWTWYLLSASPTHQLQHSEH